jgi:predicted RNA-binding protein
MFLAKAYLNEWCDKPVLQDITHILLRGEQVQIETHLGKKKVIPGRIIKIDFINSRVLLDEYCEPEFICP